MWLVYSLFVLYLYVYLYTWLLCETAQYKKSQNYVCKHFKKIQEIQII